MPSMVKLLLLAASASATFLPLAPRDYNTLLANFTGLSARSDNITNTINKYQAGSSRDVYFSSVGAAYSGFASLTNTALANCKSTGNLTVTQAQTIFTSVTQSLIPKSRTALNLIVAKRPIWVKDNVDNFTIGVLNQGAICGKDLGSCLVSFNGNNPASVKSSASTISSSLSSLFSSGFIVYTRNTATAA